MAASSLCLCQHPPEVSQCSLKRISVSSGKGLNFITNDVVLLSKYDGNYNWFDFHTIRKAQSANVVMWKDKEYEYIFSP